MNTRKIIAFSAVALAPLTLVLAIVQLFPLRPEPVRGDGAFSARFQPQLEVRAGIGTTRDLTPVQLDPPTPSQPSRAEVPPQGGHHASAASKR